MGEAIDFSAHKNNLAKARSGSDVEKEAADIAKTATSVKENIKLMRYVDPFMDWLFAIALAFAILKDILDFLLIGTLLTIFPSLIIGFTLLLVGSGKSRKAAKSMIKKLGVVGLGFFADSIPGVDFFPIESIVVMLTFYMTLIDRKKGEEESDAKGGQGKDQSAPEESYAAAA